MWKVLTEDVLSALFSCTVHEFVRSQLIDKVRN